ncbi:hypothetical protein ACQ4PT_068466 [Festuca glaucescens]
MGISSSAPSRTSHHRGWSWGAALAGAATTAAAAGVLVCPAEGPELRAHLHRPVHLPFPPPGGAGHRAHPHRPRHNPNVVPVRYGASTVSILYGGACLGTAQLDAGGQPAPRAACSTSRPGSTPWRWRTTRGPSSPTSRAGTWSWTPSWRSSARLLCCSGRAASPSRIDSHIVVDPVFLEVVEQDNRSEMQLSLV